MAKGLTSALLIAAGCLALGACAKQGQDEMGWARAALERNAALEIVAADAQARTFTVRMKDTGSLSVLRVDQIIAGPAGASASRAAPVEAVAVAATAPAPAAPYSSAEAPAPGGTASPGEVAAPDYQAAGEAQPPAPQVFDSKANPAHPAPGQVLEKGPGYTIAAASGSPAASPASSPAPP